MPSATRSPVDASTSTTTTFIPLALQARLSAAPIPLPPPVITATRPSNSFILFLLLDFSLPRQAPGGGRQRPSRD
jgi:hypothetical protein